MSLRVVIKKEEESLGDYYKIWLPSQSEADAETIELLSKIYDKHNVYSIRCTSINPPDYLLNKKYIRITKMPSLFFIDNDPAFILGRGNLLKNV